MIDDSIWHPKRRKKIKTHPDRPRRPRLTLPTSTTGAAIFKINIVSKRRIKNGLAFLTTKLNLAWH
jgi:hypothetical protein